MHVLTFFSLVVAILGLAFLKDRRPDYIRASRVLLVVGTIGLSVMAFAERGWPTALFTLIVVALLTALRIRN